MKNDLTTTALNFILAILVLACVGFGLLAIVREPRVPLYAAAALQDNNNFNKVTAILNDTIIYNNTARSPELTRLIQSIQAKPAAPATH